MKALETDVSVFGWFVQVGNGPAVECPCRSAAMERAERMAAQHPGRVVHVLGLVAACKQPIPEWEGERLSKKEMPF